MTSRPSLLRPKKPKLKLRRVSGESMLPTLLPNQIVVLAHARSLRVGDIVMVAHEGLEKIKRVARIDGPRLYLLGDNPQSSTDSRNFGWVGVEAVRGKVVWPRQRPTL